MSFWDDIKRFLGSGPSAPSRLENAVQHAIKQRAQRGEHFSAVNIGDAVAKVTFEASARGDAAAWVEELFRRGALGEHAYARTLVREADRMVWIYHPIGEVPATGRTTTVAAKVASTFTPAPAIAAKKQPAPSVPEPPNPYDAGSLLSLSADELRARALTIEPWRTAWIGRVDVIPPASDERTALVDAGLVLRGYFTADEIAEIHRVGDLWLEHRDADRYARLRRVKSADDAVAQLRKEAAHAKAEKQRAAREKNAAREVAVARRKQEDIVFLGRGVSARLADRRANVERLAAAGLPVFATPADLARAMGLPIPKLRWLAFHAEASPGGHYVCFEIAKRSGGTRLVSAPMPELAAAQRWVLETILETVPTTEAAHGFVRGRSTVSNARAHVGRAVVVNLDLEDFFPTITFVRVRGLFGALGYSPAVATILALLTTEAPRRDAIYDGTRYRVAVGPRALPQGACTSPAISNLVARKLDRRLGGMSAKDGFTYTRYADDLTFSGDDASAAGRLIARVRHIVTAEGFRVNEAKGRVQRKGGRQEVTGVVVNARPTVPREQIRRLRAILHQAKKTGLAAQNRAGHPAFEAHVRGMIAYVSMVDPTRGAELLAALEEVA